MALGFTSRPIGARGVDVRVELAFEFRVLYELSPSFGRALSESCPSPVRVLAGFWLGSVRVLAELWASLRSLHDARQSAAAAHLSGQIKTRHAPSARARWVGVPAADVSIWK